MRNGKIRFAALAVLALALTQTASAFYSPAMGRFVSRDPVRESGAAVSDQATVFGESSIDSRTQRSATAFLPRENGNSHSPRLGSRQDMLGRAHVIGNHLSHEDSGESLYHFVRNSPITDIDPLGLDRWIGGPLWPLHQTITVQCDGSCKTIEFGTDYCRWYGAELVCVATVGGPGRVTVTNGACPESMPTIKSAKEEDACLCKKFKNGDTLYYNL